MLPRIDRIGRRLLLLSGSVICMALHFAIAGLMATDGHFVPDVNGNSNLRWEIHGASAKGVIACSYIFVGVYGLTWVCTLRKWLSSRPFEPRRSNSRNRLLPDGFTLQRSSRLNTVQRASEYPPPLIGFSTLHLHTSLPPLSTTSNGRRISSSACSVPL